MHCTRTTRHSSFEQRFDIMNSLAEPKEIREETPKESIKDSRGAFGWDNVDVLI